MVLAGIDTAPGVAVDLLGLVNIHLGAAGQGLDQSLGDTGALTDTQVGIAVDITGGNDHGIIVVGQLNFLIQLHIGVAAVLHADPAGVDTAPLHLILLLNLIDGDQGAIVDLIDDLIVSIGALTDIHIGADGNLTGCKNGQAAIGNNIGRSFIGYGILVGYIRIIGILQSDPALFKFAPQCAVHGFDFQDTQFIVPVNLTHDLRGSACAGLLAHIDVLAGNLDGNIVVLDHRLIHITHGDPAAFGQLHPLDIVDVDILGNNGEGVGLLDGTDDLGTCAGQLVDIQIRSLVSGNGVVHLSTHDGTGGNTAALHLLPLGSQGLLAHSRIQSGHPFTGRIIPAHELVAFSGGNLFDRHGILGVVALDGVLHGTAVGVQTDICIPLGQVVGILAVEVHIGFLQTTAGQTHTANAPQRNGIQEVVAGLACQDSLTEQTVSTHPAGAAVKGEGDKRIQLTLGQGQTVPGCELGNGIRCGLQLLGQSSLGFLLGDGMLRTTLVIFGTQGTETDGVLSIVPFTGIFILLRILFIHHKIDQILAHRGCGCGQSGCGNQSDQHQQGQKSTHNSFVHSHLLLYSYVSTRIITKQITKCNPFLQNNYIFVTLFSVCFFRSVPISCYFPVLPPFFRVSFP